MTLISKRYILACACISVASVAESITFFTQVRATNSIATSFI